MLDVGNGVLTMLLAEEGALMRLTAGLILPDGGACIGEFAVVELDAVPDRLERRANRELLLMDVDVGVVDATVVVIMRIGPMEDIGGVEPGVELIVEYMIGGALGWLTRTAA